jgi:hypothetical protein
LAAKDQSLVAKKQSLAAKEQLLAAKEQSLAIDKQQKAKASKNVNGKAMLTRILLQLETSRCRCGTIGAAVVRWRQHGAI